MQTQGGRRKLPALFRFLPGANRWRAMIRFLAVRKIYYRRIWSTEGRYAVIPELVAQPPKSVWFRRPENLALAVVFALLILDAGRNFYYWIVTPIDLLLPPTLMLALGVWALLDARERGYTIPLLARYLFVVSTVPALGYIVWSRGWRGAGVLFGVTLLYFIAAMLMAAAGYIWATAP